MPTLPHNFPTLRRADAANHRTTVLALGSGLSAQMVPMATELLRDKRASAESDLLCTTSAAADDLYKWADEIMTQLVARGEPVPKLRMAQSLGIPSDPRWLGRVATMRNTPRHRVIARLAREGIWEQIWSFNWDCLQETALENVGVKRDGADSLLPWPTRFRTFVTADEASHIGEDRSVKIIKPHGCVTRLVSAELAIRRSDQASAAALSERFLITATELANLAPGGTGGAAQEFIFASLCAKLCAHPFVIAGWSVSETYLLNHIEHTVKPILNARDSLAIDELSIIDICFNAAGHTRLASVYRMDEATAHIAVGTDMFTTDDFFLWLQALYGVGCLRLSASDPDKPALAEIAEQIKQPIDTPQYLLSWIDNFLPVWVRLCWRCDLVECRTVDNQSISTDAILLESRDEHIPWHIPHIARPDLRVAAATLASLHRSDHGKNWNFDMFPGALYQDNRLVVPLPAWHVTPPNDLRGLKALVDSLKYPAAYVDRLAILPLAADGSNNVPSGTARVLRELISRDIALARFATGDKISEVGLVDL